MANPNPTTRFAPGNQYGGRTKGARQRISDRFLAELSADFDEHAGVAIRTMRETDNSGYMNMVARLLPKQLEAHLQVQHQPTVFTEDEGPVVKELLMLAQRTGAPREAFFGALESYLRSELAQTLPTLETLPAPMETPMEVLDLPLPKCPVPMPTE
jgi:hypothetical protein